MEVNTFISKLVSSGVPAMTPVVPPQPAATSLSHFRKPAATSTTNFSPISEAGSDAASSSYDFDPELLPAPPPPVSAFATTAPKRHAPHQPHPDLNQVLQAIADMENRLIRGGQRQWRPMSMFSGKASRSWEPPSIAARWNRGSAPRS